MKSPRDETHATAGAGGRRCGAASARRGRRAPAAALDGRVSHSRQDPPGHGAAGRRQQRCRRRPRPCASRSSRLMREAVGTVGARVAVRSPARSWPSVARREAGVGATVHRGELLRPARRPRPRRAAARSRGGRAARRTRGSRQRGGRRERFAALIARRAGDAKGIRGRQNGLRHGAGAPAGRRASGRAGACGARLRGDRRADRRGGGREDGRTGRPGGAGKAAAHAARSAATAHRGRGRRGVGAAPGDRCRGDACASTPWARPFRHASTRSSRAPIRSTRTIAVRAPLPAGEGLQPGMFGRLSFPAGSVRTLSIPRPPCARSASSRRCR